jgi:signal transduction histidine kinase
MSKLKQVTINIPPALFELGLTEAQVHGLANRWFVISLYQQGKISAENAGEILGTDRDGFLSMLDKLGVLYDDMPPGNSLPLRQSPQLTELSQARERLDALETELAETKYQLFQANNKLHQAEKIQNDFIATVSHELRTPLNSIIGFAKLLLKQTVGPLNEIQVTDLSLIYDSAKHQLDLVNDILDLSKIDAGKISFNKEYVSVEEITVGVIASTYILIADKPIKIKEEIEPNLPLLYVDRARIRQVVINLLSNAAKFTDAGTITMRVRSVQNKGQRFICYSVEDTGIGIKKEDISKVFEPFRQIDSSTARRAEGTGLGMSISARLVKLHGGQIWVDSKIGQGSKFSFTVPVEALESTGT